MERVFEAMMKALAESRAWILFWFEIAVNEQMTMIQPLYLPVNIPVTLDKAGQSLNCLAVEYGRCDLMSFEIFETTPSWPMTLSSHPFLGSKINETTA